MYGADEHIALDDVRLATEILALAAVNLLGEG
jgi:acetylornithine deacetylase/succinyl-diaminopimelate desuccinylase-like protein